MHERTHHHHHAERHHPHSERRSHHGDRRHHHPEGEPHGHGHGRPPRDRGDRHHDRGDRHRGGRARRGELRYVLLDTLRDGPRHGYEIIKAFEERTHGQYAPSPGTVYPTLQFLEELGLVRAEQDSERRTYHLTDTGRAELDAHAEEVNAFWTHFAGSTPSAASQHEIGFLRDELDDLMRTLWNGLRGTPGRDNQETVRQVRQAVEQCKNEVRRIIAASGEEPQGDKL